MEHDPFQGLASDRVLERNLMAEEISAMHLWDARTLAIPVAPTIYRELGEAGRKTAGINEGLIRISVGLERADDLLADFAQAFDRATSADRDSPTIGREGLR